MTEESHSTRQVGLILLSALNEHWDVEFIAGRMTTLISNDL